ncbi:hypothetical protein Tco_1546660 [Tanacetum coccineum]
MSENKLNSGELDYARPESVHRIEFAEYVVSFGRTGYIVLTTEINTLYLGRKFDTSYPTGGYAVNTEYWVNEKVYAAQVGCEQCKGPHTKDCPLKEEAYYTQFGGPFQGGGYRAAASGFYQRNNTNPSYQERRQSMKETLSKFMSESAKRHEENSNMIKEIRASMDTAIRNQGASIKTLEIQIGQMSKVLQERGFGSLPSSTEANPRDHVKSISTTVEADTNPIRRMGSSQYAVSTSQNSKLIYDTRQMTILFPSRLNDYYCEEKKGSYGLKLLEANSYEASHINNSIPRKEKDPGSFTLPCYINNVCFDNALADLGPVLPINVMSKKFYNSIMKDKIEFRGRNELGDWANIPIFIGNFYVLTNFTVVKDMDPYLDEGMGEVVVGKPFCEVSCVETKRFDGMITIYDEDECVTYQMDLAAKKSTTLVKYLQSGILAH